MPNRVQGGDRGLPDRTVHVAEQTEQRLECLAVAEAGEGSGDGEDELGIVQHLEERAGRFAITDAAQGDDRRLPRLEVLRGKLLCQQIHNAGTVAHKSLDDLRAHQPLPEEPGQGPLDRRPAQPPHHAGDPA